MIKIWGRNTSSNVQKVMWAVGEIGLPHQRIDIGGPFGKTREPAYLADRPHHFLHVRRGVPPPDFDHGFFLAFMRTAKINRAAALPRAA